MVSLERVDYRDYVAQKLEVIILSWYNFYGGNLDNSNKYFLNVTIKKCR